MHPELRHPGHLERRHAHAGAGQQIRPRQSDNRSKRGNDDQAIAPDHCLKCGVDGCVLTLAPASSHAVSLDLSRTRPSWLKW